MPIPKFSPRNITAVEVFLERFQTRFYVGRLEREENLFTFSYDANYLNMKNVIPLGPEFPMTQQVFTSTELFPSFQDRLPDPQNPTYAENCTNVGVAVTTTDPIVLLARFKKGPSSFIFEPAYQDKHSYKNIEKLKNDLQISLQDFAYLFDVSLSALQKIKKGSTPGKEILRQIELYLEVPEALEFQIQRNSKWLHAEKIQTVQKFLESLKLRKEMMTNKWKLLSYQELDYTQKCLQQLQNCSWARDLIQKIDLLGFLPSSMPTLFEIRFAYALHKASLIVQNEYIAGVGKSDVDFLVTQNDGTKWLIELTSLDESEEVKRNTVVEGGFQYYQSKDPMKNTRRAHSAFFGKAAKLDSNSKNKVIPTKFPELQQGQYHIIILDMRGFAIGSPDCHDYKWIVEGYEFQNPETKQLEKMIGLFDPCHPDPRSKGLQERIHGVGFISESHYAEGEIQTILELFHNHKFFDSKEELRKLFPLRKDRNYNPRSNPNKFSV